jgi:hypothetical protein
MDNAAIAMDAVTIGLAVMRFGGRDGSLAAQSAVGYPARAKGSEAWLLPFTQNPEIGTSCTGGAERRRLGRVRLLDENRGPHNEPSRVSGEMRGVVDYARSSRARALPPQRSSRKGSM